MHRHERQRRKKQPLATTTTHARAAAAPAKQQWASASLVLGDVGDEEVDDGAGSEGAEEEVKGGRRVRGVEGDERFGGVEGKLARIRELARLRGFVDEDEEEDEEDGEDPDVSTNIASDNDDDEDDDDEDDQDESHLLPGDQTDLLGVDIQTSTLTPQKPLTLSTLQTFNTRLDKTGVCYLSRIPPFMKPQALRVLLSQHGTLGRIYLAPEDPKITARRRKYKGNRRVNFVEGWVEFEDKRVARRAAEFWTGRNVGGTPGGRFYDDLWSLRYLPRFKWHHLTDQISYERAVREQKLRAEMASVKRENKEYLRSVSKSKMIQAIETRKLKRAQEEGLTPAEPITKASIFAVKKRPAEEGGGGGEREGKRGRTFRQRAPVRVGGDVAMPSETQVGILGKIFGRKGE
ncbi:RNA-binding ATPase activator esf2 [Dinochytrium kinnereticum]|nr:RNA-binding ATPase activator esf2 [Dinochytrium kinnereticum]